MHKLINWLKYYSPMIFVHEIEKSIFKWKHEHIKYKLTVINDGLMMAYNMSQIKATSSHFINLQNVIWKFQ